MLDRYTHRLSVGGVRISTCDLPTMGELMIKVNGADRQSGKFKERSPTTHPMRMSYWDLIFDLADLVYILLLLWLVEGGYQHLTQPVAEGLAKELFSLLIRQKVINPFEPRDTVIANVDAFVKEFAKAKILAQREYKMIPQAEGPA